MPVYRNSSWAQRVMPRPGVVNNLTDVPLRMHIKAKPGPGDPVVELSTENGGIVMVDAAKGVFDLVLSETQAAKLTAGTMYFDIKRMDTKARLFGGRILVEEGVTYT